ncbi:MAG: aspartate 1-decarboxylase [Candidatus Omnitrophica bacterium]|nr:aspartate 1-decarboxylase [Candidatus Omnitrophota bacterium]
MWIKMLKSKIHRATVTDANLEYEGSVTVDQDLLDGAHLIAGEKVLIVNLTNGVRIESYAMAGKRGSGTICMNGGAAHHAKHGNKVIIMSFCELLEEEALKFKPYVVLVDDKNKIVGVRRSVNP